ncbi:hypothetical protein IQ06DRAFT_353479 [Phaeosphaeriaceae sp. SRC1lsM3a]|nr:hypothetical protein IQ06DRAFT_353479 [Stagonospora sp. SRC1lsM3a]
MSPPVPNSTICDTIDYPICREPWLGPWQPSPDNSFELDSDPLSEALARRLLQPIHTELDRGGIFTWDNALDTYTGFEDVFGDIQYPEDGPSRVTANVDLCPLMEWLQDLQETYDLQLVEEQEANCVSEVVRAVIRLRRKLEERIVHNP